MTLAGGIVVQAAANAANTISAPLTLGAPQTWQTADGDAQLTVNANVNLNARTPGCSPSGVPEPFD
jgi:hypothetical protein